MDIKAQIFERVVEGDAPAVKSLVAQAIAEGVSAEELLNESLIAAMSEVGSLFERREFFVPEMLVAARAMKAGVELLKPILADTGVQPIGTVVMGTVAGDLHDIGKNLVVMMLEGAGFRVIDVGVDVTPDKFVLAAREHSADIVGMSALLTTTMVAMKSVIDALDQAGLRPSVSVMVGGAPVTQRFADEIGADHYGQDASAAVRAAKAALASR